MKKSLFIALQVIFLCLITNNSQALPPAFNATYKVSAKGMTIGNMTASLTYAGNQYKYSKSSQATGLANLFSGDKIKDNGEYYTVPLNPSYLS